MRNAYERSIAQIDNHLQNTLDLLGLSKFVKIVKLDEKDADEWYGAEHAWHLYLDGSYAGDNSVSDAAIVLESHLREIESITGGRKVMILTLVLYTVKHYPGTRYDPPEEDLEHEAEIPFNGLQSMIFLLFHLCQDFIQRLHEYDGMEIIDETA